MKERIFVLITLLAASIFLSSCEGQAGVNIANRPANTANNASAANTATSAASVDADVKKLMNDLAGVLARNDADAAANFYAEDYRLITPAGVVQTKSERLADMRSGATKFDSFSYNDINVRSYGDTAVAVATVKATGRSSGLPRLTDMRATLVFRKMADGWKVVSGQATPITGTGATATNTVSNTSNTANASNVGRSGNTNRY